MRSWGKEPNKVQDTLGLRDVKKTDRLHDNSIVMNDIDKDIYHDTVDTYETMQENLEAGLQEYAPFTNLSEDIYNALYKYKPEMREADEMKSFNQFNHGLMQNLIEDDSFKELHRSTRFDMLGSAVGTEVLQSAAMSQITEFKQHLTAKRNGQEHDASKANAGEVIEKMNQQGDVQNQIDNLLGGRNEDELSAKEAQKLAEYQEQLNQIQEEIEVDLDGREELDEALQKATKNSLQQAITDVGEIRDIVATWGLESGTHGKRISVGERKDAIERIRRSPRLKDLTDIIGRMKAIAMQKKKKKLPKGHSIENVEVGRKLEDVLPSEKMKLAHPATKRDFMVRHASGQLLQYKKSDIKQIGRGPIVVCHDKSGSMQGKPDDWATALTLAMLEIAQKEKRNFGYIPYESQVVSNMVRNILPGELDPNDIMDIAEFQADGGTNFTAALTEAMNCMDSVTYKKGDIVFITDGDCSLSEDFLKKFLKAKQDKEFYVNSILINVGSWGASDATLKRFSDNVTTIKDLADLDNPELMNIFRIVDEGADEDDTANAVSDPNAPATP